MKMVKNIFLLLFGIAFCLPICAQRIGLGTDAPIARVAIDSGLVIDQGNFNNPFTSGGNVGLWFGNPARAGITSHKNPASSAHKGLSFYTENIPRMHIDQFGRMGINSDPDPVYRLRVNGSIFSTVQFITTGAISGNGDLRMGGRASINSSNIEDAALFIKGRTGTPASWGQHIVLERVGPSTDRAGILLDGDGIKMRFLHTTGQYYWRNSDNVNMMRLDANRNLFVGGTITADGRGMVSSPNSEQWQVREFTQGNINFASFSPGGVLYVDINITGLGFVEDPYATALQMVSNSDNLKSSMFLTAVVLTNETLRVAIRNVGTSTFTASNLSIRILLMGRR